jgi:hypothetical protein
MTDISETGPTLLVDETLNSDDAKKTAELVNALAEEGDMMNRMQEEKEKLLAANNVSIGQPVMPEDLGSSEVFGTYSGDSLAEETAKYRNINVQESKDDAGRTFLRFFDGRTTSLIVVVFRVRDQLLVSVNDRVIPFSDLMAVQELEDIPAVNQQVASHDLRAMMNISCGDVIAHVRDKRGYLTVVEKTYTFKNTSVPLMMMALTRLSAMYEELTTAAAPVAVKVSVEESKVAEGATKGVIG